MIAPLDAARVRAGAAATDLGDVAFLGVRHHSPACALHVRDFIRAREPSAILVEGPRDFTELLDVVLDERARAPFAIYSYAVAGPDERRSAFYPFCDYSPELVALREGRALGAELAFVDLTYAEQCVVDSGADADERSEGPDSLMQERWSAHNRYLDGLAARLGCRDHDELWDHLFESRARGRESAAFFGDVFAYCATSRADSTEAHDARDGSASREREMAWHVSRARERRRATGATGPIVVVTGGYHTVALPELVLADVERPVVDTKRFTERFNAVVRYGYERLDRLSGYASGMRSPAFYQRLWEARGDDARAANTVALDVLLDLATELRLSRGAASVSSAAVIAACEQARALAALRGRPGPSREDVLDAIRSTFVKGSLEADGAPILAAAARLFAGDALGSVPPNAGRPPLVADAERRLRMARLKIDDSSAHDLSLDLYRRSEHRATSRLFRALELLAVPFATFAGGPDFVLGTNLDRLHERWTYAYGSWTEAALVEAARYGTTVPEAAAAKFDERLAALARDGGGRDAARAVRTLAEACVVGLHAFVPRLAQGLREAIASDASFTSLVDAATQIALLADAREPLDARDLEQLPGLLVAAYDRSIFLARDLATVPADAQSDALDALLRLHALVSARPELDGDLLVERLRALVDAYEPPLLLGAAAGLLAHLGALDDAELDRLLVGHLAAGSDPRRAVAFIRGLMRSARELAWQRTRVLATLDAALDAWSPEDFVAALPELRLAFSEMTPLETDRIAESVAQLRGDGTFDLAPAYDTTEAEVLAHAASDLDMRRLLERDGLDAWLARP